MRPIRGLVCLAAFAGVTTTQTVLRTWTLPAQPQFVGDLDGDDVNDFVIVDHATRTLTLHSTRAAAVLGQIVVPPPTTAIAGPYDAGDVDGDGRDDLFVAFQTNTNAGVSVVSATGTALHHVVLFASTMIYLESLRLQFDRLGDITGDGKAEFLIGDVIATVGGIPRAGRLDVINGATGAVLRSHTGSQLDENFGLVKSFDDVDGDGKRDFISGSLLASWSMYSGATGLVRYQFPIQPRLLVALGDVDADGAEEFAFHYGGGKGAGGSGFTVYSGANGSPIWNHSTNYGYLGFFWLWEPVGDLDGDGHADLSLAGSQVTPQIPQSVIAGRDHSVLIENANWQMRIRGSPGDVDGDGVWDLWWTTGSPGPMWQVIAGIAPGVVPIGHGCPDLTGVTPVIGIGVGARLGRTMTVNLSRAHPNLSAAILGVGYSQTTWLGVPLPIDLGPLGLPGCSWFVRGEQLLFLPAASVNNLRRHATHTIDVPADNQLLGLDLFCQWAVLDPPANGLSGAVTRAIRTRVVP